MKRVVYTVAVLLLLAPLSVYFVLPEIVASGLAKHPPEAVRETPESYRLVFEDVAIPADSGVTLAGWWIPDQRDGTQDPSLGTVLLSHGIFHNREQVLTRAVFLARAGYRVLLFDLRGHGASTPAPLSGGMNEAKDFDAALRYLKGSGRDRKPVVLFGLSLSAMAALRAVADGAEAAGLVADSPLVNGKAYVSRRTWGGAFLGLPGFFDRCLASYNRRTGLALRVSDLDLVPYARKLNVPVLYLSGEKNDLAPPKDMQKLFSATRTHQRRMVFIPGAGHDEAYQKFRIGYERAILEFLGNMRNGFPKPRMSEFRWPSGGQAPKVGKTSRSPKP